MASNARLYVFLRNSNKLGITLIGLDPGWNNDVNGVRTALITFSKGDTTIALKKIKLTNDKLYLNTCLKEGYQWGNLEPDTEYAYSGAIYGEDETVLAIISEKKIKTLNSDCYFDLPFGVTANSITAHVTNIDENWDYITNAYRCARWYIAKSVDEYEGYEQEQIPRGTTAIHHMFENLESGVSYKLKCEIVHIMPLGVDDKNMVTVQYSLEYLLTTNFLYISNINMARGYRKLSFSWDAPLDAVGYAVTLLRSADNSVCYEAELVTANVTIPGLMFGEEYTFKIRAKDSNGSWGDYCIKNDCVAAPAPPVISVTRSNGVIVLDYDVEDLTNISYYFFRLIKPDGENVELNISVRDTSGVSGRHIYEDYGSGIFTIYACTYYEPGDGSRIRCITSDGKNFVETQINISDAAKPEKWEWESSEYLDVDNNGEIHPVTAEQWNDLRNKINAMRTYRGLTLFDFGSDVQPRQDFDFNMYNDARAAIQQMGQDAGSAIPGISASTCVDASLFEILRDEFNATIDNL